MQKFKKRIELALLFISQKNAIFAKIFSNWKIGS